MKKHITTIAISITLVLAVSIGIICIKQIRQHNYDTGMVQGYLSGYQIGYTDALHGKKQNSQMLAGDIVPYELGSGKWKGFVMGFPEGYDDGQNSQ